MTIFQRDKKIVPGKYVGVVTDLNAMLKHVTIQYIRRLNVVDFHLVTNTKENVNVSIVFNNFDFFIFPFVTTIHKIYFFYFKTLKDSSISDQNKDTVGSVILKIHDNVTRFNF